MDNKFLFKISKFLLYLSISWTLSYGQTCSITGSGSCSRSKPCRNDHPFEDVQCLPYPVFVPLPPALPEGISRCPMRWGEALRCKYPIGDSNMTRVPGNGSVSVSTELNAIDYNYFAVNISWSHPHIYSGGYELRIKDDGYLIECYCISDPDLSNLYVDSQLTFPPFSYHTSSSLDIELILLTDALPEDSTSAELQIKWPSSCLDILHNSTTCALPVYGPPSEVAVHQYFSRSSEVVLDVQWQYETMFTLPSVYYVEVYNVHDIFNFYTFMVTNSTSILIGHLDPSVQYGVRVQSYVHCSGLANRTYDLGCGLWSRAVSPILNQITGQKSSRIKIRN